MIDISGMLPDVERSREAALQFPGLRVNSCGYQKMIGRNLRIDRYAGRHDYQFIYVAEGRGTFRIGNRWTEAPAGGWVLYRPGEPQIYRYEFRDAPEVYWIHFDGRGAESVFEQFPALRTGYRHIGAVPELPDLFRKMVRELQIRKAHFDVYVAALFMELCCAVSRRAQEPENESTAAYAAVIRLAAERLHATYNRKQSVRDMARAANLSLYRFIHNFHAVIGKPPLEYVVGIRMDKARELLRDSSMSVGEVGALVGYDDPLYFSRAFKKAVGMAPSEYRKTMGRA